MTKDTTINIRTNTKIKEKARRALEANGISLSTFINSQLLRAAKAKTLTLDFEAEEPSEMLIQDLKESEEDRKAGRVHSFDSIDESMDFLRSLRNEK